MFDVAKLNYSPIFLSRTETLIYDNLSEQVSCLGVPVNTFFVILCLHTILLAVFHLSSVYVGFICVVK